MEIIAGEEGRQRRTHLHALIARLRERLQLKRWRLLASETAIQPVIIADNATTIATGQALMAQGLWVGAIRPPTVPAGTARLRITLSAAHTIAQVDQLAGALMAIEAKL
jgi:8-amino-7-oxononanoate synthase